jgi:rare lipoprotein A
MKKELFASMKWCWLVSLVMLLAGCASNFKEEPPRTRVIETPQNQKLKGWQKPYEVFGQRYHPLLDHEGFVEEGLASWYGRDFHGKKTSNGEIYNMHDMTAAHKTLPLGIFVRVTNNINGRETIVRLNDRGPFVRGRIIDLSYSAAKELEIVGPGTAPVRVEALGYRQTGAGGEVRYQAPRSYDVGSYTVQIGAFTILENAERLAAQMRDREGYAVIERGYVGNRLFYRVRAGKYTSLESAENAAQKFTLQGFPSSFVVATN